MQNNREKSGPCGRLETGRIVEFDGRNEIEKIIRNSADAARFSEGKSDPLPPFGKKGLILFVREPENQHKTAPFNFTACHPDLNPVAETRFVEKTLVGAVGDHLDLVFS